MMAQGGTVTCPGLRTILRTALGFKPRLLTSWCLRGSSYCKHSPLSYGSKVLSPGRKFGVTAWGLSLMAELVQAKQTCHWRQEVQLLKILQKVSLWSKSIGTELPGTVRWCYGDGGDLGRGDRAGRGIGQYIGKGNADPAEAPCGSPEVTSIFKRWRRNAQSSSIQLPTSPRKAAVGAASGWAAEAWGMAQKEAQPWKLFIWGLEVCVYSGLSS